MRDRRSSPFCWQDHRAVELIHGRWSGRERTTALAIYGAMTYSASVQHRRGAKDEFAATRAEIAAMAGCKAQTVSVYADVFEAELDLIERERRQDDGGRDLPNVWVLKSPPGGAQEHPINATLRGAEQHPGSSPKAPEGHPPTRAQETAQDATQRQVSSALADDTVKEKETSEPSSRSQNGNDNGEVDQKVEAVREVLTAAADRKGTARPSVEAVRRAMADFPDRDHLAVAGDLDYWMQHGAGAKRKNAGIANTYRNFLRGAKAAMVTEIHAKPDWLPWVREHLPEFEGYSRQLAVAACSLISGQRRDVTADAVRENVERKLAA